MGRNAWIDHWEPEDPGFWAATGRRVAVRNLVFSVFAEHVGFSVWSLMSVLVLFMGPAYGFEPGPKAVAQKFLLVSVATLVGAVLRVPYTFAVARFGGRNWTVISAALLLLPTIFAAVVMKPGVSYGTLLVLAVVIGVGGGNFASSMTNVNAFYPQRRKGWALGVNAGGGNLGVAVVQLVGLAVIAGAGVTAPRLMLAVYIPLVVLAAAGAALFMDNLSTVRNDTGAALLAVKQPHMWIMSLLYVGTFGSFIGYSFAFGLVLQNQFLRTPLQAAALTFLGPLIGSLTRSGGGALADRFGGARVTLVTFALMAVGAAVCIAASSAKSLPLFVVGFLAVFALTGIGNGSTYRMIPAIFKAKGEALFGDDAAGAAAWSRRVSGAVIGLVGAVGALGGLFINLAFRESFLTAKSGIPAFVGFLVFYAVCCGVTYLVYVRRPVAVRNAELAYQSV
jgi:NNP family nitrate/nitrite transporter-like MFS transporter